MVMIWETKDSLSTVQSISSKTVLMVDWLKTYCPIAVRLQCNPPGVSLPALLAAFLSERRRSVSRIYKLSVIGWILAAPFSSVVGRWQLVGHCAMATPLSRLQTSVLDSTKVKRKGLFTPETN